MPTKNKPFFVLAPMDDVTDTVFRQVIADLAAPDLFFTEFVNVDALRSKGREATLPRLRFTKKERPLIAQLWGLNPDNFYKSAKDLVDMGFDGVDLNFGCPDKNVVRNGACSAMILPENRGLAVEIIQATKSGIQDYTFSSDRLKKSTIGLSVKTRLGFDTVDLSWHELLLNQKLNMLTIHGRTRKEMSKVPANWEAIGKIRELRDKLSPDTLIVGNGDVMNRSQGSKLAARYLLDGIMIGRGVFHDPLVFSTAYRVVPWKRYSREQRIALYREHVELFAKTWTKGERKIHTLNKFCKIYINGFDGAKELREKLMTADNADELLRLMA